MRMKIKYQIVTTQVVTAEIETEKKLSIEQIKTDINDGVVDPEETDRMLLEDNVIEIDTLQILD